MGEERPQVEAMNPQAQTTRTTSPGATPPASSQAIKVNSARSGDGSPRTPTPTAPSRESRPHKLARTPSGHHAASSKDRPGESGGDSQPTIDPLSRHILRRTNTENTIPHSMLARNAKEAEAGASEGPPVASGSGIARSPVETAAGRGDNLKAAKDKKKGVAFLSRFIGSKKRDPSPERVDNESEVGEPRTTGMDAEVFSQPLGFIPRHPAPPKYIKVKSHDKKKKDFDRVFLAQELLGRGVKTPKSPDEKSPETTVTEATPTSSKSNAIWAMEFSKDGRYLAAAGQDKKVRVWAVISTAEERQAHEVDEALKNGDDAIKLNAPVFKSKPIQEYEGHTSSVLDLSWSKNNFLLSSSMDKTVRLWHISRSECLCCFKHNDFVTSIQFHPRDDRFFLAGSLDSKLRLWSIPDKSVAYWTHVSDMVTAVAFGPDGKTAIAGCLNGLCLFYETEGLKVHSQIQVRSSRSRKTKGSKITGIDTITLPPGNPNGEVKLLITSNDSRIRLYNFKDRNLELKFRGNENTCSQIHATFSDDGRYVMCGSEDRKAYIWPTVVENQEKRPVEVFEAHSAIVTTAIIAPTKTRVLLAGSGDPLYDLCNPPPVKLVSRAESHASSTKAPTENGHSLTDVDARKIDENPAYQARHAHPGGNIIITADYTGKIKIFRQDCAYQKRRNDSWDNSSIFSKKMLGRSGSINTRNSISSVTRRDSLSKHPSADRILSWRNSIATSNHGSHDSLKSAAAVDARPRSVSPRKVLQKSQRIGNSSPRHGSTPLASTTSIPAPPSITTSSPPPSLDRSGDSPDASRASMQTPDNDAARRDSFRALPIRKDDPLALAGNQSYMYWNSGAYHEQAMAPQRTPGLLTPDGTNPLSRKGSVVSALSSEASSYTDGPEEEEELRCRNCGETNFKASRGRDGQQRLTCKNCGMAQI